MNPVDIEALRDEVGYAAQAAAESDDLLRRLNNVVAQAAGIGCDGDRPGLNASDAAKLVSAQLALDARLRDRHTTLRKELESAERKQREAVVAADLTKQGITDPMVRALAICKSI